MESLRSTRRTLKDYSVWIGKCSQPAAQYAFCVSRKDVAEKDMCQKEFQEFKNCIRKVARK